MMTHANMGERGVKRRWLNLLSSLIVGLGLMAPALASAQDFPSKPITVIVPHAAGSQPDTIMRLLQPKLQDALGQLVTVEAHSGAAATIGTLSVVRAEPDGHTILFATGSPITRNPFMQKDYPFDPLTDLEPISRTSETYAILVAPVDAPFDTVEELISYAREHPGELTYSSAGIGSAGHVVGEMLNTEAGIDIVHVPYGGGSEIVNAVLGGHVSMTFAGAPVAMPHVEDGTLKVIASADRKRVPDLPDVPAINEIVPGVEVTSWHAFYAPAGTPEDVIDILSNAIRAALEHSEVGGRLDSMGVVVVASTPQELRQWGEEEYHKLEAVIASMGIEPQ